MKFHRSLVLLLLFTQCLSGIGQYARDQPKVNKVDSGFNVRIHADSLKCIVTVDNPSANCNYVFEWYDMPLEVLLRRETQKNKFTDTLGNLNSEHNYEVRVYKITTLDSNKIIKRFSNNSDQGWKYACIYYVKETEVFTPNGDGYNETWGIKVDHNSYYSLKVYTRKGELVFETFSDDCVWNGINEKDQSPCPDGAYFYVLEYSLIGQQDKINTVTKGIVNLLRNVK